MADDLHGEVKADGHWVRVTTVNGGPRVHGHRVLDCTGGYEYYDLPEAVVRAWFRRLPPDTCADGELTWPEHFATDVVTAIRSHPRALRLMGFAVPLYAGQDLRTSMYEDMRAVVKEVFAEWAPPFRDYLGRPTREEVLEHIRRDFVRPPEGVVLKGYGYHDWWKVKPRCTADVVILGVKPGRGKFAGQVGALVLAVFDDQGTAVPVGDVGTGMDAGERRAMSSRDIGRACEVAYDEVAARGRLKFPRFLRWRDDKDPRRCDVSQFDYLPRNPFRRIPPQGHPGRNDSW